MNDLDTRDVEFTAGAAANRITILLRISLHEVKTTSCKEQEQQLWLWLEQQLHELEEQVHKAEVNQHRLFLLIAEVEHMRLMKQYFIMIFTHMKR